MKILKIILFLVGIIFLGTSSAFALSFDVDFDNVFGFYDELNTRGQTEEVSNYSWYSNIRFNNDHMETIAAGFESAKELASIPLNDRIEAAENGTVSNDKSGANSVPGSVPEPANLLLLGAGLIGFAGASRKNILNIKQRRKYSIINATRLIWKNIPQEQII